MYIFLTDLQLEIRTISWKFPCSYPLLTALILSCSISPLNFEFQVRAYASFCCFGIQSNQSKFRQICLDPAILFHEAETAAILQVAGLQENNRRLTAQIERLEQIIVGKYSLTNTTSTADFLDICTLLLLAKILTQYAQG